MIEYRRADIHDIDALARMRVAFSYEGREAPEAEVTSLLENNRQYFRIGMADGSFVAWIALDDGKIIATSGLTIYCLPPNRGCPNGKTAYIGNLYTTPEFVLMQAYEGGPLRVPLAKVPYYAIFLGDYREALGPNESPRA